jgi:site-specific DNA-adenine methylase
MATRLRPFFSFYGSKWRLAPKYPTPEYNTIIEPFAGSAGYSLCYPEKDIVLVERDPAVSAVWRWLISARSDDILSLPLLKAGDNLDDYNLPEGARQLVGFWVGRARWRPCSMVTKNALNHNSFQTLIDRCAAQVEHIRHWRIIEGDYREATGVPATWFVDPPYQVAGKSYKFGSDQIDYASLAKWCKSRNGQVIVCENDGATWLPFEPFCSQQGMTYNGIPRNSKEVVWYNDTSVRDMAA